MSSENIIIYTHVSLITFTDRNTYHGYGILKIWTSSVTLTINWIREGEKEKSLRNKQDVSEIKL